MSTCLTSLHADCSSNLVYQATCKVDPECIPSSVPWAAETHRWEPRDCTRHEQLAMLQTHTDNGLGVKRGHRCECFRFHGIDLQGLRAKLEGMSEADLSNFADLQLCMKCQHPLSFHRAPLLAERRSDCLTVCGRCFTKPDVRLAVVLESSGMPIANEKLPTSTTSELN